MSERVPFWALTKQAFGRHGDTTSSEEWGNTHDRQRANTKDEDPTGLLNEGFRYRDLDTGTFLTRDPLGFVDGPNVYTYVVQNPWTKFDPLGLSGVSWYDPDRETPNSVETDGGIAFRGPDPRTPEERRESQRQHLEYTPTESAQAQAEENEEAAPSASEANKSLREELITSQMEETLGYESNEEMMEAVRAELINQGINSASLIGIGPEDIVYAGGFLYAKVGGRTLRLATNRVADLSSELARTGDDARRTLRNALGLGRGSVDEAHHLIPVGLADHDLVQRAARGGFNFNGLDNGMALSLNRHRGVNIFHHNKYNNAVETVLDAQMRRMPNMTDAQAAEFLSDYANQLRNGIQNSTGRLR